MIRTTLCLFLCFWLVNASFAQQQNYLGIFKFSAKRLDVVGIEDDLAYQLRSELSLQDNLVLLSQRKMEVELGRKDIAQTFSFESAYEASNILNLNFVLIGQVDRVNNQIVADLALVSQTAPEAIKLIQIKFRNQAEIPSAIPKLAKDIAQAISDYKPTALISEKEEWLDAFNVNVSENSVAISWSVFSEFNNFIGFNAYISNSQNGPFDYATSETEERLTLNDLAPGDFFIQLSLIDENGDELNSSKLIPITVTEQILSNIDAPSIVNVVKLINGVSVEFFPAATNFGDNAFTFELLKRTANSDWQIVNSVSLKSNASGSSRDTAPKLERLVLSDNHQGVVEPSEYVVRAASANEKGKASEIIVFNPSSAPVPSIEQIERLRTVKLNWLASELGEGYKLYRRNSENESWRALATLEGLSKTSYTDTDFDRDGIDVQYAISVYDSSAESRLSDVSSVKTRGALPPPKNLSAASGLANQVKLTWETYEDVDLEGYSIFRSDYNEQEEVVLKRVGEVRNPLSGEYIDTESLEAGKAYFYAVAALNAYDTSGTLSKLAKATTKPPPPAPDMRSVALVNDKVQIDWDLPQNTSGESVPLSSVIVEKKQFDRDWKPIAKLAQDATGFIDSQVLSQSQTKYRVKVIGSDGLVSSPSDSLSILVDVPLLLNLTSDGGFRRIPLTWEGALGAEQLSVYINSPESDGFTLYATLDDFEDDYALTNELEDNRQYQVYIETLVNGRVLAKSNTVTSTTKAIPIPQNVSVVSGQPRKIELAWDAIDDETLKSYVVFRGPAGAKPSDMLAIFETPDTNTTSFTDTTGGAYPISNGETYAYAVAAKNIYNSIGFISDVVNAASKPLPQTPTIAKADGSQDDIVLHWQLGTEPDLEKVIIERKWQHEQEFVRIAELTSDIRQYEDDQLLPYIDAEYRIQVVDSDGLISRYSQPYQAQNKAIVRLKLLQDKLLRRIDIAWSRQYDNVAFEVQRSTDEDAWISLDSNNKNTSFNDSNGLADQTVYFYRVNVLINNQVVGTTNTISGVTKALPSPPSNIEIVSGNYRAVSLKWSAIKDADTKEVVIFRQQSDGGFEELDRVSKNETEYLDDGSFFSKLDDGQTYSYKIGVTNTFDVIGPLSEAYMGNTKPLPQAPISLSLNIVNSAVDVSWIKSTSDDIVEYHLYRGNSCSSLRKNKELGANATQYTDTAVRAGQAYCYSIKVQDSDGLVSEFSQTVSTTMP